MKNFRTLGLAFGLAFAIFLPGLAKASLAESPEIKVGTNWTFKKIDPYTGLVLTTYKSVVTEKKEKKIKVVRYNSEGVVAGSVWLSQNLGVVFEVNGKVNDADLLNFPLNLDDTWTTRSYWANAAGAEGSEEVTLRVVGTEKITLDAGVFDVVKVFGKGKWENKSSNNGGLLVVELYYSPTAQTVVRTVRTMMFYNPRSPAMKEIHDLSALEVK